MNPFFQKVGAFYKSDETQFIVWAPLKNKVEVVILDPERKIVEMKQEEGGYWKISLPILPGTKYVFRLDNELERPDPASVSQMVSVHEASTVVDRAFNWSDAGWKGQELSDLIIYELHTGTFTAAGTFEGIISKLGYLTDLGVNAIEIMPVAQFPGERNWGYDGVYPFAAQDSYGGVAGLKKLVDEAHAAGIAVILDVVYNHMGPDGNYLQDFAPYFTDKYKTPWGEPLNFDSAYCDGVRNFFIQNALMWLDEFHIDGLRLDAVNAIWDFSAVHFMQELKAEAKKLEMATGRRKVLIAEIDLNNPRYINPIEKGGYGLDGQWNDEFHHALHSVITGETDGYYEDFGALTDLEKSFRGNYVYDGNFSKHRNKLFGAKIDDNPYGQFVVFTQNHDQVGNRALGDRLASTLSHEALKLAAATMLLSPNVPLLFMGEEYGEKNPFLFFIHHHEELANIVRAGRKKEFSYFNFKDEYPDPQSEETFKKCMLSWNYQEGLNRSLFEFYKYLIQFRKTHPVMRVKARNSMVVHPVGNGRVLAFERFDMADRLLVVLNFNNDNDTFLNNTTHSFRKIVDSSSKNWSGTTDFKAVELRPNETIILNPTAATILEKI